MQNQKSEKNSNDKVETEEVNKLLKSEMDQIKVKDQLL